MEITEAQCRKIEHCLPRTARQCPPYQPPGAERHLVCSRERLQVAKPSQVLWPLAYGLHPYEPMGQKRGVGRCLCCTARRADPQAQDRGRIFGQHLLRPASPIPRSQARPALAPQKMPFGAFPLVAGTQDIVAFRSIRTIA